MSNVDKIIDELRAVYGASNNSDLARKMDIGKSTIASWRRRGRVPKRHTKILESGELPIFPPGAIRQHSLYAGALLLALVRYRAHSHPLRPSEIVKAVSDEGVLQEFTDLFHAAAKDVTARALEYGIEYRAAVITLLHELIEVER